VATVTAQDRSAAHRLPDEFLELSGNSLTRAVELVTRHWGTYDQNRRAQLAEALLPLFDNLLESRTAVTDDLRSLCEGLVSGWIFRQP
jgi:hypothetical protein